MTCSLEVRDPVTDSRAFHLDGWAAGQLFLQQTTRVPVLDPLGSVIELTDWCRPSGPCVAYFEKARHVPADDVVRGNPAGHLG